MGLKNLLSADNLFKRMRAGFERVKEHRAANAVISLSDVLMSAFAMFSLKDSSLLEFEGRREKDDNLKRIYKIERVPSDSQMRTILDEVPPEAIRPLFKDALGQLESSKVLSEMVYFGKYYLLTLDGTGYFSSTQVHCEACLEKKNHKTGQITYSHQLMGGAIVHPDFKEVFPLMPEAIIKQDGQSKNDCERNAAKRFLRQVRQDHPDLPLIITEDGLSSNAPHLEALKAGNFRFILGVKEGDHAYLFKYVNAAHAADQTIEYEQRAGKIIHRYRFINQVPLNESHQQVLVNFLQYWEIKGDQVSHFSWITDFTLTKWNVGLIMRGGRARWKIENETFNTLKNQGYHFEHNYGHGQKNLSVNFACLMMLAFLIDQIQQRAYSLFQAVLKKEGSRKRLWQHLRALFYTLSFSCMEEIYRALLYGYNVENVVILGPS
ncbi:MAG TPA: transposase [Anaerolineae bacterium]